MADKLIDEQRAEALADFEKRDWKLVEGRDAVEKTYQFPDFVSAFGWMSKVAILAEKMNHHPEWTNVYGTVHVVLTTHDAGGLSDLDLRLSRRIDRAVKQ